MQHAVSVLRVSTKKQLTEGEGIENQRRGNNAYLERKRYRLVREFVLAESADDKERADFQEVLDYLVRNKRDIDVVVFWKMDRISRAGVGAYYALKGYLAKHGVRIEFATEQIDGSPVGELMESLLAATARFENRLRVDRTIGVERILTKEGYWCRGAPTGFLNARDPHGKPVLRPDPGRWELLRFGLLKQATGSYKSSDVAAELAGRGFLGLKGNPLSRQAWERICRNPLYGGWICGEWTDGQRVRAKFEGPLTPEEWERLQETLDGRNTLARRLPRRKANPEFPLRRFLRCPMCDRPVRGYAAVKRNGKRFSYYDCADPSCHFRIPIAEVHRKFVEMLGLMKPSPDLLEQFRFVVLQTWEQQTHDRRRESNSQGKRVTALREERETLVTLMKRSAANAALVETLQRDFDRVDRELTLALTERNEAELEEHEAEAVLAHCTYFLENASELWQKWPVEARSRMQVMLFPHGLSFADLQGKRTAQRSIIYDAIADLQNPATLAAPRCRMANSALLQAMIAWYKTLQNLPGMEAASVL